MSVHALRYINQLDDIDRAVKTVLKALAELSKGFVCYARVDTIAELTGFTCRYVQVVIKRILKDPRKLIKLIRREGRTNKIILTNYKDIVEKQNGPQISLPLPEPQKNLSETRGEQSSGGGEQSSGNKSIKNNTKYCCLNTSISKKGGNEQLQPDDDEQRLDKSGAPSSGATAEAQATPAQHQQQSETAQTPAAPPKPVPTPEEREALFKSNISNIKSMLGSLTMKTMPRPRACDYKMPVEDAKGRRS